MIYFELDYPDPFHSTIKIKCAMCLRQLGQRTYHVQELSLGTEITPDELKLARHAFQHIKKHAIQHIKKHTIGKAGPA